MFKLICKNLFTILRSKFVFNWTNGIQFQGLLETVRLIDLICKIDGSHIPKAFTELKRLSSQSAQDQNSPRILLTILQFLLNHCKRLALSIALSVN